MNVPPRPLSPMVSPQPMGSSAPPPPPPDESANTSGILSLIARTLQLGKPWENPYADPAGTIIDQAIAQPPTPDDGQRQRGMPQVYPKGFQQSMGGGLGPLPTSAPRPAPVPQTAPQAPAPAGPAAEPPPGPGVPPPSVPEDGSENVGMGTGPGRAVSHDQAAGIAGGAVNLGTQLAGDPSITGQIIQDLRTKGYADNSQNAWLALAQAGFAAAASHNPTTLGALGEGAVAGLSAYQNARAQRAQQMAVAGGLEDRQTALAQQGQYQKASIAQDDKKLAQQDKEFAANLAIAQKKLPGDLALQAAQAQYYADHGQYYQNRGVGGVGGGSYLSQAYQTIYAGNIAAGMPPAQASADAMQKVKGVNSQRDRLINQYIKMFPNSLNNMNTPTPQALDEAGQWADQQLATQGMGGVPQTAAAPAAGGSALIDQAKQAIAAGADRAQVAARLKANGVDPALLGQ